MLPVALFVARQVRENPPLRRSPPRLRSVSLGGAALVIATVSGLLALSIVVG